MSNLYNDNNFELIKELQRGNEEAYTYLVKTYHKALFVYALSLTHDHAGAQDIVQNVFIKTWEFRNRLNPDYGIKNFLYKTTYNEFTNYYHKTKAISKLEETYVDKLNELIEDDNAEVLAKKIAIVFEGINKLPKKCKEALLLSIKEGLTNMEIADYLKVSVKTVEGHITKAYKILRENLASGFKN